MNARYYVTTAIDYVNNLPHLGTAYEKIGADCFARWHRQKGEAVTFLMGTDEHSQKVVDKAREAGQAPKAFCDRLAQGFEEIWHELDLSYDVFLRTTEPRHFATVKSFLERLHAQGDIYPSLYKGYYDVASESFITERERDELVAKGEAERVSWVEEESWFFKLSKYQGALERHFATHPDFVEPAHWANEVRNVLAGGLLDVCISRRGTDWGIPLPFDPAVVTYVWFDALINYVTGAGYADDRDRFARTWPADCHVIGKDISRFHCLVWPAMLLAAGLELPRKVLIHGFVYFKGKKISKSEGTNKIYLGPLDAARLFGTDALRYFLLRHVTYGQDGNFTWALFLDHYDAELANELGNLVSRVRTLIAKEQGGRADRPADLEADVLDRALAEAARSARAECARRLDAYEPHRAIETAWELVQAANRYVDQTQPWHLARDASSRARLGVVLYQLAEATRWLALLLAPVIPRKAQEIWSALGLAGDARSLPISTLGEWGAVDAYVGIVRGSAIFPRADRASIAFDDESPSASPEPAPATKTAGKGKGKPKAKSDAPLPPISIDDVGKLELRVATITAAHRIEGADKLLRLELDVGGTSRQIVSGIAQHYAPEALVGAQIVVIANLAPAVLRGVESQGMLLAADDGTGVVLVQPARAVASGARVR